MTATEGERAPPALEIRILGPPDVRSAGASLPALESARAASLLGHLLVHHGVALPRQQLAFLLWPDSTEPQARTNLRHLLHTLRRELPDAESCLEVTPRTLRWRADAPCRLDLAEFERALAEGDLEGAVERYGGDLLEGIDDEWVLQERARLRDRYADALGRLERDHEERGEWEAALRCAGRLVRLDPLDEAAHGVLMRVHDARGDRVRAMRAYHAYAGRAQRELGLVPSAAMRAAYEALLLADDGDGDGDGGAPGAPAGPPGPPLVGRTAERARLSALWRGAERGGAQLVLVTGEPGVGKTRLVEELRSWCAHRGALTAEARAYPAEGAVAYGPVAAWLRSDALAPRLRRLERPYATELARLLPELETERPGLPRPEPLPEAEQRGRLFAAVARALLAGDAPLLLVADDLHWFDGPTLQLLHYLLRAGAAAPLLVAATARREELDAAHPVGELTAGLQALERFTEIALDRLGRAETAQLAERMLGAPLAEAAAERLFADSEGNPLFLVEAVQAAPDGPARAAPARVGRVEAVIAGRLARLSPPAEALAGLAATIGREFSAPVLADAAGIDAGTFVAGLDELWRRGIVRAQEHDVYDFSHGRIREAAYARLGPAQRRQHHLLVAGALERAHGADGDAASGMIAAQYDAAGAAEAAVRWHVRAADAAQRLHDHAGALRALERALALCRRAPAGRERDERELAILSALPAPLNALHGYGPQRLVAVHERAFALARGLDVEPEAPLVRSCAVAALTHGDFAAARAMGDQLRTRGERQGDDVLVVEGEWVLALAAYWSGRLPPARAHLEAALARWRPAHRAEHLLRYGQDTELVARVRLAHTLWLLGHGEEAARTRGLAVAQADARGHPHTRALVHLWAALIALDAGDEARLRTHAATLDVRQSGPVERAAEALAGLLDVLDGRLAQGVERARRVADAGERGEPVAPGEQGLLLRVLVEACRRAGDPDAGVAAADRALGTPNGAQPWAAEIRRRRAAFLRELDPGDGERREERAGNGGGSTMAPSPDDPPRSRTPR
jgi:DNA-binding SARP family transcriptional activator